MNLSAEQFPTIVQPLLRLFHVDFAGQRLPSTITVIAASLVAIVGSLGADALLVALGTRVFPSTQGYGHFRFVDYSRLTVIGVIIACVGWPLVVRLSSTPRWLFFRLAVLVSIVLLAPDAYLWYRGDSAKAVLVLVWMHVAIAVVTYYSLVTLAPVPRGRHAR
jgi:hypothetical protein